MNNMHVTIELTTQFECLDLSIGINVTFHSIFEINRWFFNDVLQQHINKFTQCLHVLEIIKNVNDCSTTECVALIHVKNLIKQSSLSQKFCTDHRITFLHDLHKF